MDYLQYAELYALFVVGIAGLFDMIYREIDTELWMSSLPLGIALGYLSLSNHPYPKITPYALTFPVIVVLIILYYLGYIGGADAWLGVFLSLSLPVRSGSIIPAYYLAVIYSTPFILGYYLCSLYSTCSWNCIRNRGVKVRGIELVEKMKWWIPKGEKITGDPHEIVASGNYWEETVTASPLLPLVSLTWMGLVIAVILGDKPLINLMELIIR